MQDIIQKKVDELSPKLTDIRRDLHRHPELSFKEYRTSGVVADILKKLGFEVKTGVGKTGVVGLLRGAKRGKTFALRADMDALPMREKTGLPYASETNGVMHACGHDVHTSILLGTAMALAGIKKQLKGSVKFIFQPSEEGVTSGAKAMIDDGVLENPKVDAMFGLHVWPTIPVGTATFRKDIWMAATSTFEMIVHGRTAHATAPHLAVDATVISAQIITALQTIAGRQISPLLPVVISFVNIHGGPETFGSSIVDKVKMNGLLRATSVDIVAEIRDRMKTMAGAIARGMGGSCKLRFLDGCPEGMNDVKLGDLLLAVGKKTLGNGKMTADAEMHLGGEDFTFFSRQVPSCFIYLGAGTSGKACELHTPGVIIDEACIPTGVELMSRMAVEYLNG